MSDDGLKVDEGRSGPTRDTDETKVSGGVVTGSRAGPGTGQKPRDEVALARAAVRRAIVRLVDLLASEDPEVLEKSARDLQGLGPWAVGPLASGLRNSPEVRHRRVIVKVLGTFGRSAKSLAYKALVDAQRREPDLSVSFLITESIMKVVMDGLI